jgi:DMSO/TMAO reductase YedYZ molybdopterin-dependent catalytic subunit
MKNSSIRSFLGITLCMPLLTLTACGGDDDEVTPVTPAAQIQVGGEVERPAAYTVADLQKQTAVTQTVTYASGTTPQTRTYTGASLWSVIDGAGIKTNAAVRNDLLGKYVVATGADGYRAVFSTGELRPEFGNRESLLAYAETLNGVSAALSAADGPVRVTAPGDVKGGRYVSNLTRLDVRASGSTKTTVGGGVSTSFTISGAVVRPGSYNLAALQALPSVTRQAGTSAYTGLDLWYLLNTVAGIKPPTDAKNATLAMYVVATGSDGYQTLVSLGEIDPGFGAKPDLVAYSVDGVALTQNGFARLVLPEDQRTSRYVSNLIDLEVFAAPVTP